MIDYRAKLTNIAADLLKLIVDLDRDKGIVRCEDCEYWQKNVSCPVKWTKKYNDFCSYGVRKENDANE